MKLLVPVKLSDVLYLAQIAVAPELLMKLLVPVMFKELDDAQIAIA